MAHVTVQDWQRKLLYVDGRLQRVLEPGRHRYNKRRSTLVNAEMRWRMLTVPGQELITADGVTVRVSVAASWRVTDPVSYVSVATSAQEVLYGAVQEAIRDAVAATSFDDALADRTRLSAGLTDTVQDRTGEVGIGVADVRARDLMLPGELRRAAMERVVARERGQAELERARAEAATLRSLANTARLLEQHPSLLHLRTLQAAQEPGTKLVVTPDGYGGRTAATEE